MLWRNSRGRPLNAPAAYIHPCQPTVAKGPPPGPGWVRELKHDGYRLQIHGRDGSVRYPRLRAPLIIDAEVVHLSADGVSSFDALHNRTADEKAVALAFDIFCGVTNFLPPFAISGLRASYRSGLRPFINRGLRKVGSRSKIRNRPRRTGQLMVHSNDYEGSCCHFADRGNACVRPG